MTSNTKTPFCLAGKIAMVTGGGCGIGRIIGQGLCASGGMVYVTVHQAVDCHKTAEELATRYGCECIALPADLSSVSAIEELAAELRSRERRLDILVKDAGASWGASIEEFPEIGWDKVMNLNLKSVFFLTQKFLPLLRASGKPDDPSRVINIGSIDGLRSSHFDVFSYGASKAAVHHLTRFLARHLTGEYINCNAIAPGPYPSRMLGSGFGGRMDEDLWKQFSDANPSSRVGTTEDIAGPVIFLSSRAGSYVVGEVIASDGGLVGTA